MRACRSYVLTASLVGVLVGSPLLGYVGDRYGRKAAILLGSVIYGVTTLAVIWQHGYWATIALRFCTGIGLGGLMPNTIALNSELSPRRLRATLVVLMFTGITLGSSAPGFISAWMLPTFGWSILFLVGGAVPLLVAGGLYFALPESVKFLGGRPKRRPELLATARRMRPDLALGEDTQFGTTAPPDSGAGGLGFAQIFGPGFKAITPLLWVCFITTLMANYFLNSWMPTLFNNVGLTPEKAALASSLYHIGGTVGGLLISVLLDRFGFVVIAALFVLAAPAIAAIGGSGMSYGGTGAARNHCRTVCTGCAVWEQRGGGSAVPDTVSLQRGRLGAGHRSLWRDRGPSGRWPTDQNAPAHAAVVSGGIRADGDRCSCRRGVGVAVLCASGRAAPRRCAIEALVGRRNLAEERFVAADAQVRQHRVPRSRPPD